MKKVVVLSIILVLISCGSSDPVLKSIVLDPGLNSEPKNLEPGKQSPYFWKVEKEGKTSYFLGTVHVGVSMDELMCRDEVLQQLAQSDLVFVETPSVQTEAFEQAVLQSLFSADGSEFGQLKPVDQTFLREKGAGENFNWVGLYFFLAAECLKNFLSQNPALSGSVRMDKDIESFASLREIPVNYLDDSAESQMFVLKSFVDRELIEDNIRSYSDCPKQMKQIVESYKTGKDLPPVSMSPGETDALLTNRNKKWLNKFVSAIDNYDHIFLAAGVAHFFDPSSLLDMVRKEGFSVSRVSCK